MLDIQNVRAALAAEATAADLELAQRAYGRWGAHRAYVVISGQDGDYGKKGRNAVLKALEIAGARLMPCHGCNARKGIYLGYDNFEGGKYAAKGMAIVRELEKLGVNCWVDAAAD